MVFAQWPTRAPLGIRTTPRGSRGVSAPNRSSGLGVGNCSIRRSVSPHGTPGPAEIAAGRVTDGPHAPIFQRGDGEGRCAEGKWDAPAAAERSATRGCAARTAASRSIGGARGAMAGRQLRRWRAWRRIARSFGSAVCRSKGLAGIEILVDLWRVRADPVMMVVAASAVNRRRLVAAATVGPSSDGSERAAGRIFEIKKRGYNPKTVAFFGYSSRRKSPLDRRVC
jgi:hypothetical protein